MQTLSLVTTHFFDLEWTRLWVERIRQNVPVERIHELVIINQDRTLSSRKRLEALDPNIRVLEYPRSDAHFRETGHDHAHVLNCVIRDIEGELVCLFDSDAHPISPVWLEKCEQLLKTSDAVLARDTRSPEYSHPCFMLLKREQLAPGLAFDEGLFDRHIDTGRLVGDQLRRADQKIYLAPPRPSFGGKWGSLYLDSIYHHGQGSFKGGEERLRKQLTPQHEFFRQIVIARRRYALSTLELAQYYIKYFPTKAGKQAIRKSLKDLRQALGPS